MELPRPAVQDILHNCQFKANKFLETLMTLITVRVGCFCRFEPAATLWAKSGGDVVSFCLLIQSWKSGSFACRLMLESEKLSRKFTPRKKEEY